MNKFVVIAHPRSGSTAIMKCIVDHFNASIPEFVPHYELFNFRSLSQTIEFYGLKRNDYNQRDLLNAFWESHSNKSYVGFKTLAVFHKENIFTDGEVTHITIKRDSKISTIISTVHNMIGENWKEPFDVESVGIIKNSNSKKFIKRLIKDAIKDICHSLRFIRNIDRYDNTISINTGVDFNQISHIKIFDQYVNVSNVNTFQDNGEMCGLEIIIMIKECLKELQKEKDDPYYLTIMREANEYIATKSCY